MKHRPVRRRVVKGGASYWLHRSGSVTREDGTFLGSRRSNESVDQTLERLDRLSTIERRIRNGSGMALRGV